MGSATHAKGLNAATGTSTRWRGGRRNSREKCFLRNDADARAAARKWGYLAGLWHDLGKFSLDWQRYLSGKSDAHRDEVAERVDHSTAGAQYAVGTGNILGHLLAFSIAGHHSGLLDAISENACLEKRITKQVPSYTDAPAEILSRSYPELPPAVARNIRAPFVGAFFTRLLFSALVDADFLATEAFMNPAQARERRAGYRQLLSRMSELLDKHIAAFPAATNAVDRARRGPRRVPRGCGPEPSALSRSRFRRAAGRRSPRWHSLCDTRPRTGSAESFTSSLSLRSSSRMPPSLRKSFVL